MANTIRQGVPIIPVNANRIIPGQSQIQLPIKPVQQKPDNAVEYKLRVPKNLVKRYSVMKLHTPRPVKVDQIKEVYMARKSGLTEDEEASKGPSYGAGSEYGKDRKEEAKKRRRGYLPKDVKPEDLPFTMQLGGKNGKCFTGRKEGAILDNSSYYILTQCADRVFEAIPVQAWYTFSPDIHYHTLSADEVEHEFSKREKTINFYNLMAKKRLEALDENEDGVDKSDKVSSKYGSGLMIHDDDDDDEDEFEDVSDDEDVKKKPKDKQGKNSKGKKNMYHGKSKKPKQKDSDDDDGDSDQEEELENIESKEFDYLSESSSDDEVLALEDEPEPDKADTKLKAKDDLSAAVLSDSSSSEEETNELTEEGKELKELIKKQKGNDDSSSEDEDEDDEDIDNNDKYSSSALFLQGKEKKRKGKSGSNSGSASSSRSCTPTKQLDNSGSQGSQSSKKGKLSDQRKRPLSRGPDEGPKSSKSQKFSPSEGGKVLEQRKRPHSRGPEEGQKNAKSQKFSPPDGDVIKSSLSGVGGDRSGTPPSKKIKSHRDSPTIGESRTPTPSGELCITEESIIRYLSHKPMTTTDLVRKFKTKRTGLSKEQTVKTIAAILKKLGPDKETIDNKLYLSIKPKK